jgi:hypothetical protein
MSQVTKMIEMVVLMIYKTSKHNYKTVYMLLQWVHASNPGNQTTSAVNEAFFLRSFLSYRDEHKVTLSGK